MKYFDLIKKYLCLLILLDIPDFLVGQVTINDSQKEQLQNKALNHIKNMIVNLNVYSDFIKDNDSRSSGFEDGANSLSNMFFINDDVIINNDFGIPGNQNYKLSEYLTAIKRYKGLIKFKLEEKEKPIYYHILSNEQNFYKLIVTITIIINQEGNILKKKNLNDYTIKFPITNNQIDDAKPKISQIRPYESTKIQPIISLNQNIAHKDSINLTCDGDNYLSWKNLKSNYNYWWFLNDKIISKNQNASIKINRDGIYHLGYEDLSGNERGISNKIQVKILDNPIPKIRESSKNSYEILPDLSKEGAKYFWFKSKTKDGTFMKIENNISNSISVNSDAFYYAEVVYANGCKQKSQTEKLNYSSESIVRRITRGIGNGISSLLNGMGSIFVSSEYEANERKKYYLSFGGQTGYNILNQSDIPSRLNLINSFSYGMDVAFGIDNWEFQASYFNGKIWGDDRLLKANNFRNLHFRNNIQVMSLGVKLFGRNRESPKRVNLYALIYGSLLYHNPQAKTPASLGGQWIDLRPLGTEGQGLPGYDDFYPKFVLSLGGGLGIRYKLSYKLDLRFEITHNDSGTDYLDDISKTYVDRGLFKDALTSEISERSLEPQTSIGDMRDLPLLIQTQGKSSYKGADGATYETLGTSFKPGNKRGKDNGNDSYWIFGLHLNYIINLK